MQMLRSKGRRLDEECGRPGAGGHGQGLRGKAPVDRLGVPWSALVSSGCCGDIPLATSPSLVQLVALPGPGRRATRLALHCRGSAFERRTATGLRRVVVPLIAVLR